MVTASIIIPACDEERVIGELLDALTCDPGAVTLEVIVVANGCSDETVAVAAGFPGVRVIETPVGSKPNALRLGDSAASHYPRCYVDADVVVDASAVGEVCKALDQPGVLASAPERRIAMAGSSRLVRWYYDIWLRLPAVRDELFGRGVIAVNAAGHARLNGIADVMSDDLAATVAFASEECRVVPTATSVIRPPRTYRDLLRRRVRAMAGNRQLDDAASGDADAVPSRRAAPRNSLKDVARLGMTKLWLLPKVAVFVATAVASRRQAQRFLREDGATWLRDESSRAG